MAAEVSGAESQASSSSRLRKQRLEIWQGSRTLSTSYDVLPPRLHLLKLCKQHHQLGTKCPNTWSPWGIFSFKPHSSSPGPLSQKLLTSLSIIFSVLFKGAESKISSETQGKPLTVSCCKMKRQVTFNIQWNQIYITIPEGRISAQ